MGDKEYLPAVYWIFKMHSSVPAPMIWFPFSTPTHTQFMANTVSLYCTNDDVPKTNNLNKLDKLIFATFVFTICSAANALLVGEMVKRDKSLLELAQAIDYGLGMVTLPGLYVLLNVYLFVGLTELDERPRQLIRRDALKDRHFVPFTQVKKRDATKINIKKRDGKKPPRRAESFKLEQTRNANKEKSV